MNNIHVTPRLQRVAQMVRGTRVADIGTDHGKLLIYLVQKCGLKKGIGSDVAIGPANACRRNVLQCGLSEKIEIRVGDGLSSLQKGEAETIVLAGMGGELILRILQENLEIAHSAEEIILQPMTNVSRLLEGLPKLELEVTDAALSEEKDKLYQIFKVQKGTHFSENPLDFLLCPLYFEKKDPLFDELLKRELEKQNKKLIGMQRAASPDEKEILAQKALIEEIQNYENRENYRTNGKVGAQRMGGRMG